MASRAQTVAALATIAAAGAALAIDVTRPGDPITPSSANSPAAEGVANVIDNTGRTKYLNFDRLNTGFTVTPSGAGVVKHMKIITANDAPARDPTSFTLEGSNDGVGFTMIASGPLTPSITRFSITSTPITSNTTYVQYRVRFPTLRDPVAANSMQVAEVQLATSVDITSPDDMVTVTYTPGASSNPTEGPTHLFDNAIGAKFDVLNGNLGPTTVDVTPLAGATVVTGMAYISANDDQAFPGRTPQNITLLGSNDGTNFTQIFTTAVTPATDNFQDQEFEFANAASYTQYRLIFDIPQSSTDMQVGEIELYGVAPNQVPPDNDACANARVITAGQVSGTTNLAGGSDITPCGNGDNVDVWYRYTSAAGGLTEASTCDSSTDTTVAVYDGCGGNLLACDDNGCGLQSIARWTAVANQPYLIRVALVGGATGAFRLNLDDAPAVHTDVALPLAYNFNGMVHAGEAGLPDAPTGYRSISDRGLEISSAADSIAAGTLLGTTRIAYSIVRTPGVLDIVHLGDRNTVDNNNHVFDLVIDGDNVGVQPDWLLDTNQTGAQTTNLLPSNLILGPDTRLGVLYQISNGGGDFLMTLTFDDTSTAVIELVGPDWFFDQSPGPAFFGVEVQTQLGVFAGAENVDQATHGASLNVVEAIVSTARMLSDGIGDFTGKRLASITFSDRTNTVAGYAIIAASVRDGVPACPCDWNHSGQINSQDFFDFLNDFFAGHADFNGNGTTNSQDFFDFLNCFFADC
jgi:hypothetical protein